MAYIGNTVQTQGFAPAVDYFNGDGTTVTFTLSRPVASVAQLTAVIDNVIQNPSSAFTVAGNAITFTSAPLAGTNNIWVEYTSLVTTYAAISQDPSVIGDITATGGYLAEGDFGNSYIDGTIVDYVTGNARITTGPADGLTIYNGGTTARSVLLALNSSGALGVGTSPSYGTNGQFLKSTGTSSAPIWTDVSYQIEYIVVAGGGSGARAPNVGGGGGGAGGAIASSATVNVNSTYSIVIGAGGAAYSATDGGANAGSNTTAFSNTCIGGGTGSYYSPSTGYIGAQNGGSGGGAGWNSLTGASGTTGQGNAGGSLFFSGATNNLPASGGGGKGAAGSGVDGTSTDNGGAGGAGYNWQSLGTYYAAGGGGGAGGNGGTGGAGGTGGGGAGGSLSSPTGTSGTANTGSGGGGTGPTAYSTYPSYPSGAGGSGVVVIRYSGTPKGSGGTVTQSGGYTYHTFTTSGTFTA